MTSGRGLGIACAVVAWMAQAFPLHLRAQASMPEQRLAGLDRFMPRGNGRGTAAEIALGKRLFFEPALSRDSSVACASCHDPERAFTDGRSVSIGVDARAGRRNTPPLINKGWGTVFFWDGRVRRLEDQVLQPIVTRAELDSTLPLVIRRLQSDASYRKDFQLAGTGSVNPETLAKALASYIRSITAADSPFDHLVAGDFDALTEVELQGLGLFQGKGRCVRCHLGPLFTDEMFHNTGVAWRAGSPPDSGRAEVTGKLEDVGAFRTPTLRELPSTAPYMHDGSILTLEEVVEFYIAGGQPNPGLDPLIRPLSLSQAEKEALVSFLRALAGRLAEGPGTEGQGFEP